jgi:hypothetical protein
MLEGVNSMARVAMDFPFVFFGNPVRQGDRARDRRDWRKAARAYRRAVRQCPDNAPIWVQLGHALKESGDATGARDAYGRACALDPEDGDAALHYARVLAATGSHTKAAQLFVRASLLPPHPSEALRELSVFYAEADVARLVAMETASLSRNRTAAPRTRLLWDVTEAWRAACEGRPIDRRALAQLERASMRYEGFMTCGAALRLADRAVVTPLTGEMTAWLAKETKWTHPPPEPSDAVANLGDVRLIVDPLDGEMGDADVRALRSATVAQGVALSMIATDLPPAGDEARWKPLRAVSPMVDGVLLGALSDVTRLREGVPNAQTLAIAAIGPTTLPASVDPAPDNAGWAMLAPASAFEIEAMARVAQSLGAIETLPSKPDDARAVLARSRGLIAPRSARDSGLWIEDALAAGRVVIASSARHDLFWRFGERIAAYVDTSEAAAVIDAARRAPARPRGVAAPTSSRNLAALNSMIGAPTEADVASVMRHGVFYTMDDASNPSGDASGVWMRIGDGWGDIDACGSAIRGEAILRFVPAPPVRGSYRFAALYMAEPGATLILRCDGNQPENSPYVASPLGWGWIQIDCLPPRVSNDGVVTVTISAQTSDGAPAPMRLGGFLTYPPQEDHHWFMTLDAISHRKYSIVRRIRSSARAMTKTGVVPHRLEEAS